MSLRERFARIIDPEAFENPDHPTNRAIALQKADEILGVEPTLDDLGPGDLASAAAVLSDIAQDREELASRLWEAAGQRLINFVGDSKEAGTCVSWEQWKAHAEKYPHSLKRTLDPFYELADALLEVGK